MTAAEGGSPVMTTANRDNFMRLSGQPLREFAHRLGVARSEAARLSDEKLKEQCRYLIANQYERD